MTARPAKPLSTARTRADERRLLPAMRGLLVAFSLLTALATVVLFLFPGRTDRVFAWTVQPPLTAAFLGAGYAAGCVLVLLALRDPIWADSRVPVLTILAFTVLTLAATLMHLDRFHLQPQFAGLPPVARAAAWFWLVIYVVVPVCLLLLLLPQERAPGTDPPARHPVPPPLRAVLGVQSVALLLVGAALTVAPETATVLWPWPLTPLTARAVAGWMLAFGVATAIAAMAGDLARLRTSAVAYTIFGAFLLVAVARFPDTLDWGRPVTWLFLLLVVTMIVTGAIGWRTAPAPRAARHLAGGAHRTGGRP